MIIIENGKLFINQEKFDLLSALGMEAEFLGAEEIENRIFDILGVHLPRTALDVVIDHTL